MWITVCNWKYKRLYTFNNMWISIYKLFKLSTTSNIIYPFNSFTISSIFFFKS